MLGSTSLSQLMKLVGPMLLILWSVWYLGISRQHVQTITRKFRNQRELFIKDFLEHEVDGRFDGAAIQGLCGSKKWTKGLLMGCDAAPGGIGEVRNAHLHCIRFAIEAGAELILPEIIPRSEDDIKNINGRPAVPLDYYFDAAHLNHVLQTYCPQMRVHGSMNDLYDVPEVFEALQFSIADTNSNWVNGTVLAEPSDWNKQFHDFINEKSPLAERVYPFRTHLKHTLWTWPTARDKAPVASSFGRMLRIRPDARRLAASALFSLESRFQLNLDPRTRYHPSSFVGVHLRTEEDVNERFPDYTTQAANYLHYLSESESSVAFLASGATETNITAFVNRAEDFNVTVVTKTDILDDEEQEALEALTWDQRGLVDYEIMLRAGMVAGVSASSFAWNLALRRSYAFGQGPMGVPLEPGETISWKDDYTTLYGRHENAYAMRATVWP
ncbi:hypothetical protein CFIO01_10755 [Colletotrichum fioriniae PJ7]|uniref:Alternative oxidase n=1 Tax=Colletotrichum fioriniae PJ7 TaxID=1445577 RepID=A0A010RWF1_9PEZI|nr:hypothetical protein CFIO01_10755 [Colletotrichum fioriniae PJ7]